MHTMAGDNNIEIELHSNVSNIDFGHEKGYMGSTQQQGTASWSRSWQAGRGSSLCIWELQSATRFYMTDMRTKHKLK